MAAPLELHLDRSRFLVERESIGSERIGGQDRMVCFFIGGLGGRVA
jgi:hypothetical protein